MSAKAAEFFEDLRRQGVASDLARTIAEAFDRRMSESKAHSDRNRAESEEKSAAKFVSREEYHKRDRDLATRADLRTEIADLRAEMNSRFDGIYRILVGIFVAALGGVAALVGGLIAVIWKLFGL